MNPQTIIFALVTAIFAAPAFAIESNPFGLDLDKHPTKYGCSLIQNGKYRYHCGTVPKPHPELEAYVVKYARGVGICSVGAIGKTIRNDKYGFTTKERVDTIAKQLKRKYGVETKKYDRLFTGSIWDEPDDWMMGVLKQERFYGYVWSTEDGFKPVAEVAKIGVFATAVANDAGFVKLEFYFKRDPQCEAIIEKAGQDAF